MISLVFVTLIGLALLAVLGIIFKENKNAVKVIKFMMIVIGNNISINLELADRCVFYIIK